MKSTGRVIIVAFLALYFFNSSAQLVNNADSRQKAHDKRILDERLHKADLVIEGKVIKKKAFWNNTYSSIYSSNTLVVYKLFKGKLASDTIEVVTLGGILTDSDTLADRIRGLSVSDSYGLWAGQEGIFFLRRNNWNAQMKEAPNSFVMYDQYQLPYYFNSVYPAAIFASLWFNSVRAGVYPLIQKLLKRKYRIISQNPHETAMKK